MSENKKRAADSNKSSLDRRGFLAGATVASAMMIRPELVRGSQANSTIKLGMIGCGNRGGWIANHFVQSGGYQIAAGADYFQDRVDAWGDKFAVDPSNRFTGLSGYKKMLEGDLDAVVVETPPYYHPEHAMAAVDAGCHVFEAKPVALDVPGCLTIAKAGEKATRKKQCFLVDFQTRADPLYQEAVRRVRAGDIGPIVNGEAVYYAGPTWARHVKDLALGPDDPEMQLRAWGILKSLSGDIITEQNIHALDVASWIVDADPIKANGTCSRAARNDEPGDCSDNFAVVFQYPGDVVINFTSGQFSHGYRDIGCRVFGPLGSIDTHYFGDVSIIGRKPYEGGTADEVFQNGVLNNIAEFRRCILEGDCSNPTVAPSVRSNLTTILGRTAAYRKEEVTWDEMMKAQEKWVFEGEDKLKS